MVGASTVIADNPQLTVRVGKIERQPWRVIADSRGRTSLEVGVLTDEHRRRTIVLTTGQASLSWRQQLGDSGVTVLTCAARDERVDLLDALRQLGQREITSVLVEGGGRLVGSLFDQRLVDKVVFFYAPKIIGGRDAPTAVEGQGIGQLSEAIAVRNIEWRRLGDDIVVTGYC